MKPHLSLDGTPANFDGTWTGTCVYADYDRTKSYTGAGELIIKQTPTDIEVRGACYRERPLGQYFLMAKLAISGNTLSSATNPATHGQIGDGGLSATAKVASTSAPGLFLESVVVLRLQSPSHISYEFHQDVLNDATKARTRLETHTGEVEKPQQ